jgi:hypothetical protein
MSDSRRSLWFTAALLAGMLLTAAPSQAQTVGSGAIGHARNPMRRQSVVPAGYAPQQETMTQRPGAGMWADEFLGTAPRPRPVSHSLAPLAMPEEIEAGDSTWAGDSIMGDAIIDDSMPGEFGDGCACGGDGCGLCQQGIWAVLCEARQRTEYYHGVTSFSGPVNRGGTGSFGFEGGLNTGSPLFGGWRGLGVQAGVGGTVANFNGSDVTRDTRNQAFVTLGLFRRVDWGLQGGVVVDHVHDDWYGNVDLSQLRGEFSWVVPQGSELGFLFAASNDDDIVDGTLQTGTALPITFRETWTVNDYYALFLRHTYGNGGYVKAFAGWTGTSDGILGAEAYVPLNDNWALRNNFAYIIPEEGQLDGGSAQEAWNLSLQLVWHPCGRNSSVRDYYRPLFNVANNGTMFINR